LTEADRCILQDIITTVRVVARLDADGIKARYLRSTGSSAALEACKNENQAREQNFELSMAEFYRTLDYTNTREILKSILDVFSANVASSSWYENECHDPSLAICLAKHIQCVISPSSATLRDAPPVRVFCFDTGILFDLLALLVAHCKISG